MAPVSQQPSTKRAQSKHAAAVLCGRCKLGRTYFFWLRPKVTEKFREALFFVHSSLSESRASSLRKGKRGGKGRKRRQRVRGT
jgi:hypothetical protein